MPRRSKTKIRVRVKRPLVTRASVHRVTQGAPLRPSADPPQLQGCPWWPLTVVVNSKDSTSFTPAVIWKGVLEQIPAFGTEKDTKLVGSIRVQSVRCWSKQPLSMKVFSPIGTSNVLRSLLDWPTPMRFARLGFRFGDVEGQEVYSSASATPTLFEVDTTAADTALVYISILMRFESRGVKALRHFIKLNSLPRLQDMYID